MWPFANTTNLEMPEKLCLHFTGEEIEVQGREVMTEGHLERCSQVSELQFGVYLSLSRLR